MKTRFILPALLLLSACGTDPAEQLAEARRTFAAQDYDAARVHLTALLQAEPENREALALLVDTYLRLGDGDAAQGALDRLRRAGGTGPDLALDAAEAALLRGLPDKALTLLAMNQTADGMRVRAAALVALGKTDQAIAAYQRGMSSGANPRLVFDYARMLLESGDRAGAAAQLAVLERMEPATLATQMLRGDLQIARQDFAAALTAFYQAAKDHPRRVEPLLGTATALALQGRKQEAQTAVDSAAALKASDGRVIAMQVQLAAETGNWAKVRDVLQPVEGTLAPTSVENLTYAEALLRLGQAEQARSRFARAHLAAPGNPYARLMLAAAMLETGDAAGALAKVRPLADSVLAGERELSLAEAAARASGASALAQGYQARLGDTGLKARQAAVAAADSAFARGDWLKAVAAYRQLPGHERDPEVLRRLALACAHGGQTAAAIGYADQALKHDPANPALLHAAGFARLGKGGDASEAIRLLAAATAAEPGNREFQRDLAKAKAADG